MPPRKPPIQERTQTGIRLERRMLKVLKATAEYLDITVGELVELCVLQAFEGRTGFSKGTLRRITELKRIYGMDYDWSAASSILFVDDA